MGVVIDTGISIAHERRGLPASTLRDELMASSPGEVFVLSAVSLAELAQGIYRARTPEEYAKRFRFVSEVATSFTVLPFTDATAWIAGRIRGEQARMGNTLPLGDSLIAALALELDYGVLTLNVSDFIRIPEVRLIPYGLRGEF